MVAHIESRSRYAGRSVLSIETARRRRAIVTGPVAGKGAAAYPWGVSIDASDQDVPADETPPQADRHRGSLARAALVALGFFFVLLGVVGIVLPLIPTTAPLLLAAALFARSSPRFHTWLLDHRVFGAYIRNYREHRGMTHRHKVVTLVTLWVGIGVSMYLSREAVAALVVLALVLVGVTLHVLTLETAPPAKR